PYSLLGNNSIILNICVRGGRGSNGHARALWPDDRAGHLGEQRGRLTQKQRRKNRIDHIILTVSDFERSVSFYAKALKPLGITNFTDYDGHDGHPDLKGFGDGKRAFFWLKEGKPDPQAVHVGFVAKNHAEVDAFYKAAVAAGGTSKAAPQVRHDRS